MSEAKNREPETPTILQPGLDEDQKAISEPSGKSWCLRHYFTTALLENREQTRNHSARNHLELGTTRSSEPLETSEKANIKDQKANSVAPTCLLGHTEISSEG